MAKKEKESKKAAKAEKKAKADKPEKEGKSGSKLIRLESEASKFGFTVDSKELDQALSKAANVIAAAPTNVKHFMLVADKKKVALLAYNPDTYVYIAIKSGVSEGRGAFGFVNTQIQGLLKGRGEMQFTFNGTECSFNAIKGKYKGTLVTLPITADQVQQVNSTFATSEKGTKSQSVLPRHVLDHLKEGVSMTGIKDVYTGNALLAYMMLNEKGVLTVSAFDNFHFGHYRAKVKAGGITFKAALPSSHFLIIDKLIEGEEAQFHIREQNMRVEGEGFVLILPSHQSEESNYDQISRFLKDLDAPALECGLDHDKFSVISDNLFTLHAVNTSFDINHKKGDKQLAIVFNTSNGSASDSMKVETTVSTSVSARVDPRMVKDLTGLFRGQGDVRFSIIKDKGIRLLCNTKSGAVVNLISALSD